MQTNCVYHGDFREGLKHYPDNFFDSIVTDPPYEIGFQNNKWDRTGIAYDADGWKELLRVLKPGGHLIAFSAPRTYHRMAVAVEDAGFEVRDMMQWIYGSGFPKSQDISKAIDKKFGAERQVIGVKPGHEEFVGRKTSGDTVFKNGMQGFDRPWMHDPEKREMYHMQTAPATEKAKQWDGYGTALKPAHEPILLARKPLSEKTIVDNILRWGTGGLNINACRIPLNLEVDQSQIRTINRNKREQDTGGQTWGLTKNKADQPQVIREDGRFPANILLDQHTSHILDQQSGQLKSGTNCVRRQEGSFLQNGGLGKAGDVQVTYGDSGGASRFFFRINDEDLDEFFLNSFPSFYYCAKPSRKEKGDFNTHSTVKPLKLMKYLLTLVTSKGGIVLDPFAGSGTTLVAAKELGYHYVGVEKEPEHVSIINKRLELLDKTSSEIAICGAGHLLLATNQSYTSSESANRIADNRMSSVEMNPIGVSGVISKNKWT